MINIQFIPISDFKAKPLSLEKSGDELIINGKPLDLNDYINVFKVDENGKKINENYHEFIRSCEKIENDFNVSILFPYHYKMPKLKDISVEADGVIDCCK